MTERSLIIDGTNIFYRAYVVNPSLSPVSCLSIQEYYELIPCRCIQLYANNYKYLQLFLRGFMGRFGLAQRHGLYHTAKRLKDTYRPY